MVENSIVAPELSPRFRADGASHGRDIALFRTRLADTVIDMLLLLIAKVRDAKKGHQQSEPTEECLRAVAFTLDYTRLDVSVSSSIADNCSVCYSSSSSAVPL